MGVYYLELGAAQRPSTVLYDRADSAVALADPASYNWGAILDGADWFHFTGITPALSSNALRAVTEGAVAARDNGLTVSCDLNFRKKLWSEDVPGNIRKGEANWPKLNTH